MAQGVKLPNTPTCVVEVARPEDVSNVIKIIGNTRTPFAIKSGGHASNPGFSSTPGVFISLVRLNEVTLSSDKSTVEIGTGNVWTDVYAALDGTDVNVVGGRVTGPGVGGFSLGGGYSWLINQYRLTCDNVKALNLILPNGTITYIDSSQSDLFFALKGGLNRFGVVTSIIFNTVPQSNNVYGGIQIYSSEAIPDLIMATYEFQNEAADPKAQAILTINGGSIPGAVLLLFYDGPESPEACEPYNSIGGLNLSTVKSQSYASFSTGTPSQLQAGHRGAFQSMMTTRELAILNGGILLSYDLEPFQRYGEHATDSAFPHADSPLPLNLYYAWSLESEDAFWRGLIPQSIDHLTDVAKAKGIGSEPPVYLNYALDTYSGDQLYGATNAARLLSIQQEYDPNSVMKLAGGFSF
ncbi:FAD-binding domain-containing protein [Hyaloscypha variabilis F]|uniref:FAD-binding domain-containing protein n=1 Tax=Hyaloscypha variabilis (strain UAMH 11265 / GT02V1 / F) TaxID=1149755 RepID=A0A2J6R3U8_HYAVF|nr:FAD-binding domain-containing protein [Hyaloscypha variabilis F]